MNKCFSLHLLFYHPKFSSYQQMQTQQFCVNFRLATFCHCDPSLGQQLIANLDLGSFSYGSDNATCILVGDVIVVQQYQSNYYVIFNIRPGVL